MAAVRRALRVIGYPFRLLLTGLILGYQKLVSPLLPPSCRLHPCCSQYGLEAIQRHGAFKGTLLTGARLTRCNPWTKGGVNPVPNPGEWRSPVALDGTPRPGRPQPPAVPGPSESGTRT